MSTGYNDNLLAKWTKRTRKMAKPITGMRIREDRAIKLREKSIELTIKKKEHIKEVDIINFLIDEMTDRIDVDDLGILIKEERK